MQRVLRHGALALLISFGAHAAAGEPLGSPEQQLVSAIDLAQYGKPGESLHALEALIRRQPNFRLAQLIYAEMLGARSGVAVTGPAENDPRVRALIDEARLRLDQSRFVPEPGSVPDAVLKLSTEYPYLVLVDLPRSRLHLLRNVGGELQVVANRYASIGRSGYGKQLEGDLRTPVGVYHVTGWMRDENLPELYGSGALPLNYPNLWDRFKSRTGNGIWLHGVPRETYVRAPRSSEGCVTMANEDLLWLKPFVESGRAPVVLSDELDWIPQEQLREEREVLLARLESWRKAWAAMDADAYLGFYDEVFSTGTSNRTEFARLTREAHRGQKSARVKLSDISLFRYPGEHMLLAEFSLDYSGEDGQFSGKKEQYWRQDTHGQWLIFREENR
ncbi:MAG: L,D-transpeptidase Cds6 family protein [Panacagrimonas sp.]